jgi:hypothetical protein
LTAFVKQMDGKPYEKNLMEMVRGTMSLNSGEDLSGVFCSELVAAAYQRYPCHTTPHHTAMTQRNAMQLARTHAR